MDKRLTPPPFRAMPVFRLFFLKIWPEFLVTPKFGVLLRIRSNWAKNSEFAPKFGAPRLGQQFCSLNGWKILSRSWDMTKWRCLQKTLSARTNFVTKCGWKLKITFFNRPFSGLPWNKNSANILTFDKKIEHIYLRKKL